MNQQTYQHYLTAAKRLYEKGLTDKQSVLSLRVVTTGKASFVSLKPTAIGKPFNQLTVSDLGTWSIKGLAPINNTDLVLEKTSPQAQHAQLFALRADAGGIFVSGAKFTQALNLVDDPMPGIFDEQVRQIGLSTKRLMCKKNKLSSADKKLLSKMDNAFLLPHHQTLIMGVTHERVVFNAELMEKCAKAYVLASATGKKIRQVPAYVKLIANQRKLKDQKYTAECYQKGEMPTGFTAY